MNLPWMEEGCFWSWYFSSSSDEAWQYHCFGDKITAGEPAGGSFIKEENAIGADGKDLAYIHYEIVDSKGNVSHSQSILFAPAVQGQIVCGIVGNKQSRTLAKNKQIFMDSKGL